MVRQATSQTRKKSRNAVKRKPRQEINEREEEILRAATLELITHHGGHFVATGLREVAIKGFPVWIITVTLRYDKGDEGYLGDLVYDGEKFTFLTEQSVMDERARKIADNRERIHNWNEYRASTLRTRKA